MRRTLKNGDLFTRYVICKVIKTLSPYFHKLMEKIEEF